MRVMSTSLIGLLCLTQAVSAIAQEAAPSKPATTVKIYRVGDLVAQQTVRKVLSLESITKEEWSGEHKQTITSLRNLAKLVETIVPSESGAIAAHEESLSLVIHHSTIGHQQITELLQQLREKERPTIELTLIPLTGDEVEDLLVEHVFQTSYDPDTTRKFLKFFESREAKKNQPLLQPMKFNLTNGRKTPCGNLMFHVYLTAIATEESDEIRLRIDNNTNVEAPERELMMIQTQSFAILPGHSVILAWDLDLNDDGRPDILLAVPKRIAPEQSVTAISRDIAE